MADYYSIITNRGKELEAEALASGRLIVLTHFVVGDSNGKQVKPDPSQIRLINETYRGDIAELVVSPEQSTQLMAKIVLPTGVGGFTVREVGLMTDAGELYAVANCPSIDKPVGGVSVNMQFRLAVSDTSNITLNVATGDGLFLRIDQNLKEIKARGAEAQKTSRESIGVLDGTTQQRGLVQLNSAVNSTSETQAATPAAVKIAMDNANARLAIGIESALGGNSIVLGDGDTGFKQNGDGVLDAYSDSRQVMRIVPGGVQVFGSTGSWIYMREQTCFSSVAPVDKDGASAIVRQEHPDRHFILGGLGNHQFGIYMINKSRSENGTDGQAYLDENGDWVSGGRIIPGSYENFDARYQPRGNYATQEWVLQNFVQNIRVSAPQERKFWDGASWSSNDSAFATAIWMVGGSSNVGGLLVRYIQKLINGTWYNVIE